MKEIELAFEKVVGQRRIVQKRILDHTAFAMGSDESISVLYTGPAGLGKSRLLEAEKAARAAAVKIRYARRPFVDSMRSPQEIRMAGASFKNFLKLCAEGDGSIVDELHEIDLSSTIQLKTVKKILKDLMDCNQGKVRRSVISDNLTITRDAQDVFFASGTNYPHKISDGPAIISRFGGQTVLDFYTEDELTQILLILAEQKDLRIHEETISLISKCGRGTARPMKHIIKHLYQQALVNKKKTVNRAEVLDAMRALELYPFGLTKREVAFVMRGIGAGVRVRELPVLFAVEAKEVNDSLSFLAANGFLSVNLGKCEATPRGVSLLEQLRKEKFTLPN